MPINDLEKKALEMLTAGKPIHGLLKDILVDMQQTQEEPKSGI